MTKLPKSTDLKDATDGCMNLKSRLEEQMEGLKYVINISRELTSEEKVRIESIVSMSEKHLKCIDYQIKDIIKINRGSK